ncbi:MAG: ATP F0F1 synthase subunit B [Alphaproteobacteria bacterium]|nr:ATP F0F1 synthase subunit B [Alphaproteobacteria bacterium]
MALLQAPETWVAAAFVIFIGVLIYVGVHKKIVEALDQRAAKIKADLDEARRLREEAAQLLAEYQRKQRDAEREAAAIVTEAKAEAERVAAEARAKMEDFVARRTKLAQTKIGQAEAQALTEVRAAAADAAVAAAERILVQTAKGKVADDLVVQGIADAKAKLN